MTFPDQFIWGAATSAYQIEGAHLKDGKGPSIWDSFCEIPGKIANNENGNIACDHYHTFREDVKLMKQLGLQAYRFSISWPRIFANGRKDSINEKGIQFYNDLIDCLLEHGITPWVTLYHWDLPLALQFEEDGWLGDNISDLFADYAEVCFDRFGDRVKNWITINEAWVIAVLGYGQGVFAPGRISTSEPYQAGHNILLAHGKAVKVYREKFQPTQKGQIGITNNCDWREPKTDKPEDQEAAQRALEFFLAWFADPIYKGDYPAVMKERLGDRLPTIDDDTRKLLLGSSDFFGLNHYTTMFAADATDKNVQANVHGNGGLNEDQEVELSIDSEWKLTSMKWAVVPWGCRNLLQWISKRYDNPAIYITENGCAYDDKIEGGEVNDDERVHFFKTYLEGCQEAIESGVDLRGYFAWSLFDNFEWASGYEKRFGMVHVDFETQKRTPKKSAIYYSEVISKNAV